MWEEQRRQREDTHMSSEVGQARVSEGHEAGSEDEGTAVGEEVGDPQEPGP